MKTLGRTSCVGVTCQWLLLSIVFGESHEHDIQWGYYVQLMKSLALLCEGTPLSRRVSRMCWRGVLRS